MSESPALLIVDDEQMILDVVRRFAERQGFRVVTCASGADGERLAREQQADAAVIDLRMPGVNGLDVLRTLRAAQPACRAILVTGHATVGSAVEALKLGALDYLEKPLDFDRLGRLLCMVREDADRRRQLLVAENDVARQLACCGMVGRSPAMQGVFDSLRRFAPHVRCALIVGEPGVGKRSMARALHDLGPRRERPFVAVDCSMADPVALEAHVFGLAADGAGPAGRASRGLLDQAAHGTAYFDDVTRLSPGAQSRLLRLLEHGELLPVGALQPHPLDVVVLAATPHDLRNYVQAGRFRSDLLYRLGVVEFPVPPLRDRREDVPYLTAVFMKEAAGRLDKSISSLSPEAEALLLGAPWPGNVRELQAAIERACLLADGPVVSARDVAGAAPAAVLAPGGGGALISDDGRPLSTVEREHIQRALQRAGGNKKAAARMLGVSRRALYRKLERLDLGTTISRRSRRDGHHDTRPAASAFDGQSPPARVASGKRD